MQSGRRFFLAFIRSAAYSQITGTTGNEKESKNEMSVAIAIHTLSAPPSAEIISAAVARLQAGAEVVHACVACGSTEVIFESIEYRTGVWSETSTDEGYACKKCGAFETECDELVVMPARAAVALAARMAA